MILYLDTNHLSTLVRSPELQACREVRGLVDTGELVLAISLYHLLEISSPTFRSASDVVAMVDSHDFVWAVPVDILWDREVEAAFARASGIETARANAFDTTVESWGSEPLRDVEDVRTSTFLQHFRQYPAMRAQFIDLANRASSQYDLLKGNAVVAQQPDAPILQFIEDHAPAIWPVDSPHSRRTASEVLKLAGGLQGFPSYHVWQRLGLTRLNDAKYKTEANDVIDEWHAAYSPYAGITALDRRTVGRMRSASLPSLATTTARLDDVSKMYALLRY